MMRTKTLLKASALLAAAVVLGLLTVQGTYALWSRVVPVEAGTIQAANFRVTLTDVGTGAGVDMVDASGKSALLPLRPSGVVSSTVPAYAGVKVSNVTNAGSDFAVRARIGPASPGDLVVKARAVPVETVDCGAADFTNAGGTAEATLAKNKSAVFCFELALAATTPQTLSGTQTKITVPITVEQL
jgi:predicted ribosomally synthesized peptide with SipW-like signal peptide